VYIEQVSIHYIPFDEKRAVFSSWSIYQT